MDEFARKQIELLMSGVEDADPRSWHRKEPFCDYTLDRLWECWWYYQGKPTPGALPEDDRAAMERAVRRWGDDGDGYDCLTGMTNLDRVLAHMSFPMRSRGRLLRSVLQDYECRKWLEISGCLEPLSGPGPSAGSGGRPFASENSYPF